MQIWSTVRAGTILFSSMVFVHPGRETDGGVVTVSTRLTSCHQRSGVRYPGAIAAMSSHGSADVLPDYAFLGITRVNQNPRQIRRETSVFKNHRDDNYRAKTVLPCKVHETHIPDYT